MAGGRLRLESALGSIRQPIQFNFFKCRHVQNLRNCVETPPAIQAFPDDGRKRINGGRDPNSRLDRIGGRSRKRPRSEMPPDPLEEQLDLPSRQTRFRNGEGRQNKAAGSERECFSPIPVATLDASHVIGMPDGRAMARRPDSLITDHSRTAVNGAGMQTTGFCVLPGSGNEKTSMTAHVMQTFEIETGAVHDAKGPRLGQQRVQDVHIMRFSGRNIRKCGDVPAQTGQRMHFCGGFRAPETGHWETDGQRSIVEEPRAWTALPRSA